MDWLKRLLGKQETQPSGSNSGEQSFSINSYDDLPIRNPSEDHFGINSFAQALANSIRKLANPRGSVIALNGVWGSGKSSATNLILHH